MKTNSQLGFSLWKSGSLCKLCCRLTAAVHFLSIYFCYSGSLFIIYHQLLTHKCFEEVTVAVTRVNVRITPVFFFVQRHTETLIAFTGFVLLVNLGRFKAALVLKLIHHMIMMLKDGQRKKGDVVM